MNENDSGMAFDLHHRNYDSYLAPSVLATYTEQINLDIVRIYVSATTKKFKEFWEHNKKKMLVVL